MRFDIRTTYAHEHWHSQAHSHAVRARNGRIVGRYYRHCPGLESSMLPMTCDNLDGAWSLEQLEKAFRSNFVFATFLPVDPDLLNTEPPENALKFKMSKVGNLSTKLLLIGFHNYRQNYIKTGQQNKETNFHILMDPKACFRQLLSFLFIFL